MEFQRLLRAKALEFENVLNVARSGLDHGTQKGNIVEQKFRDYLGSLLPDRFGITEGIIYNSAGQKSKQLDVIIFDKHRAPLIFNENGTRGIPVECVFAVFEVKTSLDSLSLQQFTENLRTIRSFERRAFRPYTGNQKVFTLSTPPQTLFPILGYMFSLESQTSLLKFHQHLAQILSSQDWLSLPNSVYVHSRGCVAYHGPTLGSPSGWISYPNPQSKVARNEGPDAFFLFVGLLLDLLLVAEMYQELNFIEYFRDAKFDVDFGES